MKARDEILKKLKGAPREELPPRPPQAPPGELSLSREEMIERFTARLGEEAGVVHRVRDYPEALERLDEIVKAEGIRSVMVTTDEVLARLDLPAWGKKRNLRVRTPLDFSRREDFKKAVFDEVEAGITGADWAVAESGTLILVHGKDQARLVSLAPILHIAVVPVERLVPVYERAVERIFRQGRRPPSQVCFITGPSMTADIQATPFKGMHGPRGLIVILVG